jgi:hypothetical protein
MNTRIADLIIPEWESLDNQSFRENEELHLDDSHMLNWGRFCINNIFDCLKNFRQDNTLFLTSVAEPEAHQLFNFFYCIRHRKEVATGTA